MLSGEIERRASSTRATKNQSFRFIDFGIERMFLGIFI